MRRALSQTSHQPFQQIQSCSHPTPVSSLSLVRAAPFLILPFLLGATAFAQSSSEPVRVRGEMPAEANNRWRSILGKPDDARVFDLEQTSPFRHSPGTFHASKKAAAKEFQYVQKVAPKSYRTRDFGGAKSAWMGEMKFATKNAPTKGKYAMRDADKQAAVKTAPTRQARESGKTAATREMPGANRPYLGKEAAKVHTSIDPNNPPRWTNDLRELKTVDDVKELLNTNR